MQWLAFIGGCNGLFIDWYFPYMQRMQQPLRIVYARVSANWPRKRTALPVHRHGNLSTRPELTDTFGLTKQETGTVAPVLTEPHRIRN